MSGPGSALLDRVGRFQRFVDRVGSRPDDAESEPPAYRVAPSAVAVPAVGADLSGERKRPSGSHRRHLDQEPWPSTLSQQRYLLQAGFVDRLLGRLVRRLRERGLYERSMIVVTADHGVSFRRAGPAAWSRPRTSPTSRPFPSSSSCRGRIGPGGRRAGAIDRHPADNRARARRAASPAETAGRPAAGRRPAREPVTVSSYRGGTVRVPFGAFVRGRAAAVRHGESTSPRAPPGTRRAASQRSRRARGARNFGSTSTRRKSTPGSPRTAARCRCTSPAGSRVRRARTGRGDSRERPDRGGHTRLPSGRRPARRGDAAPRSFRKGANEIEAFAVSGAGGGDPAGPRGRRRNPDALLTRRQDRLVLVLGGRRSATP